MSAEAGSTVPSPNHSERDRQARTRVARTAGLALLDISAGLEQGTVVLAGAGAATMVAVGFAARGRRLLRAAYLLVDNDHEPEAVPLLRTMSEYIIVGRWLLLDPEKNLRDWAEADIAKSLLIDDRAFEHGGIRLMNEETRQFYEQARTDIAARSPDEAEAELDKKTPRLPSIEEMARQTNLSFAYDTAYRLDSQSAVHATTMAINNVFEEIPEGYGVRPVPHVLFAHAGIDTYALGAVILLDLLDDVDARIPELGWTKHLEMVKAMIDAMKRADPNIESAGNSN